ncbi:MAG TPA: exodeoxyribonuclease VII small subunit [Gemmatimonadaceae bacterium]|jgi:exodeoxyribonuclease VII small subunit|nr:exodeoxyribonuclease VII small subunit [Gemmatimonadaceae bacterium]
MAPPAKRARTLTFEERLARLEEIASELDAENVDLAKALSLFEEGIEHLRSAAAELTSAEATVQRLVERADGTFGVADAE